MAGRTAQSSGRRGKLSLLAIVKHVYVKRRGLTLPKQNKQKKN
jgi:hypothetical protein